MCWPSISTASAFFCNADFEFNGFRDYLSKDNSSNEIKDHEQKSWIREKLMINPRLVSVFWYILGRYSSFYIQCKMAMKVDFYALMPYNIKAISRRPNILSDTKEATDRKTVALNLIKKF